MKFKQVGYSQRMSFESSEDGIRSRSDATGTARASGEPRWLDDEEREAWLATAAIMFSLPTALNTQLQHEAGITFFEYMVLSALSERTDRTMQMSDIAAGVSASLSRLSHVVRKLEERDLLRRNRVAGPGRRTNATLTDAGYAKVVAAAPGHVAAVREYFMDTLEVTDRAVLQRIGKAVADRIDPDKPFVHGVTD